MAKGKEKISLRVHPELGPFPLVFCIFNMRCSVLSVRFSFCHRKNFKSLHLLTFYIVSRCTRACMCLPLVLRPVFLPQCLMTQITIIQNDCSYSGGQ